MQNGKRAVCAAEQELIAELDEGLRSPAADADGRVYEEAAEIPADSFAQFPVIVTISSPAPSFRNMAPMGRLTVDPEGLPPG
jgi:hypothetical protein